MEKAAKKLNYLRAGAINFGGRTAENINFVIEKQLKNREMWRKFVEVFKEKTDAADEGWRGEFFGKTMRGACLIYRCRPEEELYEVLREATVALLAAQEKTGRISSYTAEKEFCGWDMWARKYVLVGCLYFYGICKDGALKNKILSAMSAHVDYIIERIGENGKKAIVETSADWGGVNSCTILEPVVQLYKLTENPAYLRFARYILSTGGCRYGNLIECAKKGMPPCEYPETKAYETISFFEGVLAYYEATGEKEYLAVVQKFSESVQKNEITLIGSAGCTHELFDGAAKKQANDVPDKTIMQETCVTVTWMRLQERLLRLTGESVYADNFERSACNAMAGSVNKYGNKQYTFWWGENGKYIDGLPFDSYSPLANQPRGVGIGGEKTLPHGGYYGCCACIGAAGIALHPLTAVLKTEKGFCVNYYLSGMVSELTPQGNPVTFRFFEEASVAGKTLLKISLQSPEKFAISFRIPPWSDSPSLTVGGKTVFPEKGYFKSEREWRDGDEIVLDFRLSVKEHTLSGKTAYTYGAYVLARDMKKEQGKNVSKEFSLIGGMRSALRRAACETDEAVRLILKTTDGDIPLTDYASCGKHWERPEESRISVWLNQKNEPSTP